MIIDITNLKTAFIKNIYKGCFKSYLLNISFNAFAGKNFTF